MKKKNKTVLITGPTSGIGLELTHLFAQDNINLILASRNKKLLLKIHNDILKKYNIIVNVYPVDLSKSGSARKLYNFCIRKKIIVDYLVNNAGFGKYGLFTQTSLNTELDMIHLNITSLTELTKLFGLKMKKRGFGKILNIASTASFQPGPFMSVYSATKNYVLSFSEAIAEEFRGSGVSVTTLCPGPTISGFQKRAGFKDDAKMYNSLAIVDSKQVAQFGYNKMMSNHRLVIFGLINRLSILIVKFLPSSFKTYLVKKVYNYYH